MAKFLFVYRDEMPTEMPSPEVLQAVLAQWGAWIEKFMKTGQIVDPGDALKHDTGKVIRKGQVVSDGPFMESKEILGGYSIISAESYEEALKVAMECPAANEGSLEIRELAGVA